VSFPRPDGTETSPPPGLDRYESVSWWGMWKLARAANLNATGLGAAAHDHFIVNPTKPCVCDHGAIIVDGQLRTCETCRGLGYLHMTLEEIRTAYREIQARVCEDYGLTESEFNTQAAETAVRDGALPGYWLKAARGIEARKAHERAERRQKARARW
jgi:hypothetical protein